MSAEHIDEIISTLTILEKNILSNDPDKNGDKMLASSRIPGHALRKMESAGILKQVNAHWKFTPLGNKIRDNLIYEKVD